MRFTEPKKRPEIAYSTRERDSTEIHYKPRAAAISRLALSKIEPPATIRGRSGSPRKR